MLVLKDHLVTESLSSKTFWKSSDIESEVKKYNKPTNKTYFSKINSKTLNLNYNKSFFLEFSEKIKNSEKKTFKNNR